MTGSTCPVDLGAKSVSALISQVESYVIYGDDTIALSQPVRAKKIAGLYRDATEIPVRTSRRANRCGSMSPSISPIRTIQLARGHVLISSRPYQDDCWYGPMRRYRCPIEIAWLNFLTMVVCWAPGAVVYKL